MEDRVAGGGFSCQRGSAELDAVPRTWPTATDQDSPHISEDMPAAFLTPFRHRIPSSRPQTLLTSRLSHTSSPSHSLFSLAETLHTSSGSRRLVYLTKLVTGHLDRKPHNLSFC